MNYLNRNINVVVLQTHATMDPVGNLRALDTALTQLSADDHLDLICIPEMVMFRALGHRPMEEVSVSKDSEADRMLQGHAQRLEAYISVGLLRNDDETGTFANETLVLDRKGQIVCQYHKTHLFDAPDQNPESDFVIAGNNLALVEADFGKIGLVVCYEIRFPEIARQLAAAGAEILVVPNSWPRAGRSTTDAELRMLLQATANHNQAYVLHANQIGHVADLELCGGSSIIDPSGHIISIHDEDTAIAVKARIDLNKVSETRERRLVFSHRRPEMYRPEAVSTFQG